MPNGCKAIDPRFAQDVRSIPPNACSVRTQRRDKATRDQHEANKARSCSPMMPFLPCLGPPLGHRNSRTAGGVKISGLAALQIKIVGFGRPRANAIWGLGVNGRGANSTPTSNQRRALCEIDTSLRRRQPKGVCRSSSPMAAREHGPRPSRCLDDMRPAVGVGGEDGGRRSLCGCYVPGRLLAEVEVLGERMQDVSFSARRSGLCHLGHHGGR